MALQVSDRAIPLFPDVFRVADLFGQALAAQHLGMHSNDEHFLIIRTIEDANPAAFRKSARAAPEKIVLEFLGARFLETVNLAPPWVDTGHDMPDGAILSGAVHPLKNHQ